jgi:hypothetical protein
MPSSLPTSILAAALLCGLLGCAAGPPDPPNPAFAVSLPEARQAVMVMRGNPRPLVRPLVIIGGFADMNVSPPLFAAFFRSLTTPDATIIPVSVGTCLSFEECRQRVIGAVDAACPTDDATWTVEVDVVGASLGGLVGAYAAAPCRDPAPPRRLRIARLFTLSSPLAGARLADAVALTAFHRDMRSGSAFLTALHNAGPPGYELYPYVILHDGTVGAANAAPPGVNPYWLPKPALLPAHLAAMVDARILGDIARRLRGEPPLATGPPVPLPPGHGG